MNYSVVKYKQMNTKRTYFYFVIIFILLFLCSCNSKMQNSEIVANEKKSIITFKKDIHDFGEIPAKKDAIAIFNFSNSGGSPLVITEVKTSCGCTVLEFPKNIIKSSESGEIKVIYDAINPGRFKKIITVFYNGKDSPKKLIIEGEVTYPKDLDININ